MNMGIRQFRAKLATALDTVTESGQELYVTTDTVPRAVMVRPDIWERAAEALREKEAQEATA